MVTALQPHSLQQTRSLRCAVTTAPCRRACSSSCRRPRPCTNSINDKSAVVATSNDNAPSASSNGTEAADSTAEPQIECIGTAMDVQCYVSTDDEVPSNSITQQPEPVGPLGLTDAAVHRGQHVEVVETGIGASSYIVDDSQPPQSQSQMQPQEAARAAPPTAAAAAASGKPLQQLLGVALLVSPFFFWGTSMVAMKVCQTHLALPALSSQYAVAEASRWLSIESKAHDNHRSPILCIPPAVLVDP